MRIGLLGGSFNPPHEGHMHISRIALSALNLHAVWWIVTPNNPLKHASTLLPYEQRIKLCHDRIKDHTKIIVTDIERTLNSSITLDTVQKLKEYYRNTHFVWITGMDNALNIHKWNHWKILLNEICMLHITRHPAVSLTQRCPQRLLSNHRHEILQRGGKVPLIPGISYWLLQKKMINVSSTEIRNKNNELSAEMASGKNG
ncbi:MAG: nicotinate-nicotinamide nucleotide adenylyltransferase [Alphaproteobacteria bacterium]|nr:nicotinate-nicotinamide nucleotide adenylyltransferase [Alphaproteobacteria bacterium]MCB9974626.1 nicotinate-nicotinamide nucleotide adenylyltransferase [Rhodospirillales bacterium]